MSSGGTGLFKALIAALPPENPEHADEKSRQRHYAWRRAVFVFLLSFTGAITYGLLTYATAAEVDEKVTKAVGPVTAKVDALNAQVAATNELIVASLAADLEDKIVQTKAQFCKAKTDTSVKFFRDLLADFKSRYEKLTGKPKEAPSCEEAAGVK